MGVGIRLKEILREKGITIKKLSEETEIPLNTLYSITKRDSKRVDYVILKRIAAALHVPVSRLSPPDNYWEDENAVGHTEPINDDLSPQDRIACALERLNGRGQVIAAERVEELARIPEYQLDGGLQGTQKETDE